MSLPGLLQTHMAQGKSQRLQASIFPNAKQNLQYWLLSEYQIKYYKNENLLKNQKMRHIAKQENELCFLFITMINFQRTKVIICGFAESWPFQMLYLKLRLFRCYFSILFK